MARRSSNDDLDLLERARRYHYRDTLFPEEYEALMGLGAELANPSVYDAQCFILGSYAPGEKERLEYVRQKINQWPGGNCRGYLMEEFTDELHPIVQFQLIADYSDYLIGICEHDSGGFQLELGMLLAITEYRERCSLLKRTYSKEKEHEKYNWMLGAGAFDLFEYHGGLWEWRDEAEFEAVVEDVLTDILS